MAPTPDTAATSLLDAALRGALVTLLVLLALRLPRHTRPAFRRGALRLVAGLVVQVIGSAPAIEYGAPLWLQTPLIAVSIGNSVLFWLFARLLFDDGFTPHRGHAAIWVLVAGLGVAFGVCHGPLVVPESVERVLTGMMRWTPAVFAALTAAAVAQHWDDDLVEWRRRLRRFVVIGGVGYAVVMMFARLLSGDGRLGGWVALADVTALLVIAAVMMRLLHLIDSDYSLITLTPVTGDEPATARASVPGAAADDAACQTTEADVPGIADAETAANAVARRTSPTDPAATSARLAPAVPAASSASSASSARALPTARAAAPDPADDRLAARLEQLMTTQRAYAREDLTVAALAAELGVPDYRLRRLINQRLGHRNFSAYVNAYRLLETKSALADPKRQHLPILTIALEAGFQSIGPFNRAFKGATGRTPTEFRREHLADS